MKLRTILFITLFLSAFLGRSQNKSFTTKLPIVYLNTSGQMIPDDPKISAQLEIAWKGESESNSTSDPHDHFSGNIAIEVRGSSSQMFPKKSYGFELRDDAGQDMDFPLLGMPEEEDWILYAPYADKSLLRNVLTFTIADQISDTYVPRCRFVELFLNEEYEGVYVLMEKIKRDSARVDIAKLKAEDVSGKQLTGGYIIKIDKGTGSGGDGWSSNYNNSSNSRTFYQYEYPAWDEIQYLQKNYIKDYINDFETAIYNLWHDDEKGYQNYMELESFYDYFIVNELSKNVDGYRLSAFLNKDKDGKLNAGPIWDYNLAYGNADYYNAWLTSGLVVYQNIGDDYWQIPFWWQKLTGDAYFVNPLRCRWDTLRENILSDENIIGIVDSLTTYLGSAVDRNFGRWPILSDYVWPNYYIGNTYPNEVNWLKDWIITRLQRLDNVMPGKCGADPGDVEIEEETPVVFFPNPFRSELHLKVHSDRNSQIRIQITSLNGSLVRDLTVSAISGENTFDFSFPTLKSGIYFYRLTQGDSELNSGKLVKL